MIKVLATSLVLFSACKIEIKDNNISDNNVDVEDEQSENEPVEEAPEVPKVPSDALSVPKGPEVEPTAYDVYDANGAFLGESEIEPTSDKPHFQLKTKDGFILNAKLDSDVFTPIKDSEQIVRLGFVDTCGDYSNMYSNYKLGLTSIYLIDTKEWVLIHAPSSNRVNVTMNIVGSHDSSVGTEAMVCGSVPAETLAVFKIERVTPTHPYPFKLPFSFKPKE